MRKSVVLGLFLSLAACNRGGGGGGGADVQPQTEDDKTFYALGAQIGKSLGVFSLTKTELDMVKKGLSDSVGGQKMEIDLAVYGPKIQEMARTRSQAKAKVEGEKSKEFMDKAATEKGAEKLASGLIYVETTPGTGAQPAATDTVKVHYKGTLTDGTEFDSSYKRNEPTQFPLNGVIPCWTEGVQKMKVGGKAKLICPAAIAYGDRGAPPTIPGGATLVFEIELIEIVKK
jgi:FKBP-type peptidyl-prolyl cis-trans isomerase FkpA